MLTTRERFQRVVTATEAVVLPALQAVNPKIAALHFEYGHPLVVQASLKRKEGTQAGQYARFPMIAVLEDFPARGIAPGLSVITPRIIIACLTKDTYTREQRQELTFKPILWPIAEEFDRQLQKSGVLGTSITAVGTTTERPFWGAEALYGSNGNILDAMLDCIEISNKELSIRLTQQCAGTTF